MVHNFNTNLAAPEGRGQNKGIEADLAEEGLEDTSGHFLPQHKLCLKDGRTWAMNWGGREVHSQTDYVLGIDSCLFQNVAVRDARKNTDHCLVLGCLCGAAPATHS